LPVPLIIHWKLPDEPCPACGADLTAHAEAQAVAEASADSRAWRRPGDLLGRRADDVSDLRRDAAVVIDRMLIPGASAVSCRRVASGWSRDWAMTGSGPA
jgi:hypothetical protein